MFCNRNSGQNPQPIRELLKNLEGRIKEAALSGSVRRPSASNRTRINTKLHLSVFGFAY